jgi:hypothetical protein
VVKIRFDQNGCPTLWEIFLWSVIILFTPSFFFCHRLAAILCHAFTLSHVRMIFTRWFTFFRGREKGNSSHFFRIGKGTIWLFLNNVVKYPKYFFFFAPIALCSLFCKKRLV